MHRMPSLTSFGEIMLPTIVIMSKKERQMADQPAENTAATKSRIGGMITVSSRLCGKASYC